jgi:hypothetical protein
MKPPTRLTREATSAHNGSSAAPRATKSRAAGPRVPDASREAKRLAASVLEVLAGASSPTTAATALDVSLPRYYLLEQRAIEGLVAACEPRSGGRTLSPTRELDVLRKQIDRLQRESTRYQTLLRVAQRTIGLVPPPANVAKKGAAKSKRTRRTTARALVAARTLRADDDSSSPAPQSPATTEHKPATSQPEGGTDAMRTGA